MTSLLINIFYFQIIILCQKHTNVTYKYRMTSFCYYEYIQILLFDLHSGKNMNQKDDFRKLQTRYNNYQQVCTHGSKEDPKVGCAFISDNHSNLLYDSYKRPPLIG